MLFLWYDYSYIIEGRVCYLTMCDRSYPKKLAFQYLEDLKNEFERVNGNQIETAARPYAFIKFGISQTYNHHIHIINSSSIYLFYRICVFCRFIHSKDKEVVPGHKSTT